MSDDSAYRIVKVPVLDTGIGREMGYANDAEFAAAAEAKRDQALSVLTPEGRKLVEDAEREADRRFLFGPTDAESAAHPDETSE